MTPSSARKDKAPQVEKRPKEPRRRNLFSVIVDSLNEIRKRYERTRKVVRAACTMVRVEQEDSLQEILSKLSQKQTIVDLQTKNKKLKEKVKRLKEELEDEKKANATAATKLSESLALILKMEGVV